MSATACRTDPGWSEQDGAAVPVPAGLRVLIVDEREVVQWGFRLLLARRGWVERCLTARGADEARHLARRHEPQLVLLDLGLAQRTELAPRLTEVSPRSRIVLTSGTVAMDTAQARGAGAYGFVSTAATARELLRDVRAAAAGLIVWPEPEPEGDGADPARPALSRREREIVELVAEGETNREIAARLFLSPYTVKQHTTAVYRKLGVRNRTEAAQRARRLGLIP
jgi:two-component system response regulator DesR